jgi:transposase InsO family protein
VRIVHEIGRLGVVPVPSRMGVHRALVRHGLIEPGRRRREFRRWEREEPMALWQMDIVGGVFLADGSECKVVTGVDDHSRFCVIAEVVPRATGRAVCLAFAAALREFGVPGEVLTDNGKQFTDRFGHGGEVLFDRVCRDNAIVHRLTQPRSPTTTGKVERFHQTLRRELLDDAVPFADLAAARAAVAGWVVDDNTRRPHQALGMACPADRFDTRTAQGEQELLPLRLPAAVRLAAVPAARVPEPVAEPAASPGEVASVAEPGVRDGGAVESERTVPASGNMFAAGRQFWLGPAQAGVTVTFWADTDVIHLLRAGARIKSVRSHLSTADLTALAARGARRAGPPPLPPAEDGEAVEVDRTINKDGNVGLGGRMVLAAEILRDRRAGIHIEPATLMFFDLQTRELLRTRPNPFTPDQVRALRGLRRAGPPPRPRTEPVTVQRRASNTGVVMVAGQKVSLGRLHAGQIVTIPCRRSHAVDRVGRRRRADGPADHHPARPQHQGTPAPQGRPMKPRTPVKHVLGSKRQASRGTRHEGHAIVR